MAVDGGGAHGTPLTLPSSVSGLSQTYLLRLVLTDAHGTEVSRNVYSLSTRPDTLDWDGTTWYHTPTTAAPTSRGSPRWHRSR
ncbi:beta-mannosidase [Streptomyces canarius]